MYVIAYDVGTTGIKTCLYSIEDKLLLIAGEYQEYDLYILENGGAEQDAGQWWEAMCSTTKSLISKSGISPEQIKGISFCSQMQGLVLVDNKGNALRAPMSYMDQRASEIMIQVQGHGITISGVNIVTLIKSLAITNAASTSVKDPLWKYKWVEANEPEIFKKVHKWLDVKEYLIAKCTGRFVMTKDSAYSTFLYDTRKDREGWSKTLCRTYGVNMNHLPEIISSTDIVGGLTAEAACRLGLRAGTEVYGGGGDATLIGLGAGCTQVSQTHIYWGTSGWVETVTDRQCVDIISMIAAIMNAEDGKYNYFAEMETAGKCFEWVKNHLALDEVGIYMSKTDVADDKEGIYESLYDYLSEVISEVPPGAGGVIFTPWLHGNRCPFEDPSAAGMFFNIGIETGKSHMIRAVIEGICYHLKWMLECQEKKVKTSETIRFVGGGALSDVTCRILADITGRKIETVRDSKDVGSAGAAILAGVGAGVIEDFSEVDKYIPIDKIYIPDKSAETIYRRNYKIFKQLYKDNKNSFRVLNRE